MLQERQFFLRNEVQKTFFEKDYLFDDKVIPEHVLLDVR